MKKQSLNDAVVGLGHIAQVAVLRIFLSAVAIIAASSIASAREALSEPLPDDSYSSIVDVSSAIQNIGVMGVNGLMAGFADKAPWASSYWPIHKGLLGNRYADPNFPRSKNFSENYSYYVSNPSEIYLQQAGAATLSPSEKYDLLVGDSNWTLTKASWAKGLADLEENGVVAGWTGICHGWSGAAHMGAPMPAQSVDATDVTGIYSIRFYPHDIRALASLLWAQNSPTTKKAGNRCRQDSPTRDSTGRPTDPSCLDTNPMTWHLTVVNRIGIQKKSFVMDASLGPEVWNYPIWGYEYQYFNPSTFETSYQLSPSLVPIERLRADRFSATRAPHTKYVVGIIMNTYHPNLIEPHIGTSKTSSWAVKRFIYDLELDENLNLIGGEWYGKDHPDFLWTFADGAVAMTREDRSLGAESWQPGESLPPHFAAAAISASVRREVLAHIVNPLWERSSIPDTIEVPPAP